jgi:hypothetical protein
MVLIEGYYDCLEDAILDQVDEFVADGKSFSIWDITKSLRDHANNGDISISGCEVDGRSYNYEVSHDKVKQLFEEMLADGCVGRLTVLTATNQGYRIFTPYAPSSGVVINSPNYAPYPYSSSGTAIDDAEAERRIDIYLNGCQQRNQKPTLKQIQCAIKRGGHASGLTVRQIDDIVENLGYSNCICKP